MLTNYEIRKVYLKVEDEVGNMSSVKELAVTNPNSTLVYDNTKDNNLRYVGASVSNYVWMNEVYDADVYDLYIPSTQKFIGMSFNSLTECQNTKKQINFSGDSTCKIYHNKGDKILWRIIGVMNNINDGIGNIDERVKLIRSDSIGGFAWDSSSSNINSGNGINEWSTSSIKKILNDYYYNRKANQTCYVSENKMSISCNFDIIGLKDKEKEMTSDVLWNVGSNGNIQHDKVRPSDIYELERSKNTGKICTSGTRCNDNVSRTTTWQGRVGLIYPSDYGYATGGGDTNRTSCLSKNLSEWSDKMSCSENNWLYTEYGLYGNLWTMTPIASNEASCYVYASYWGKVHYGTTSVGISTGEATNVAPVVYLKPNVKIISGIGTLEQPFNISL